LISKSPEELQNLLQDLLSFCKKSGMNVNAGKTQVSIFGKHRPNHTQHKFFFNGQELKQVEIYKHLGTLFFQTLKFKNNLVNIVQKAKKASHFFWKYVNRFSHMKTSSILSLYEMTIVPVLLYNCEVWGPVAAKTLLENTIEAFHRKMLKRILNVSDKCPNAAVFWELGCLPLSLDIKLKGLKYIFEMKDTQEKRNCWKAFLYLMQLNTPYSDYVKQLFADIELPYEWAISEQTITLGFHDQIMLIAKTILVDKYAGNLMAEIHRNQKLSFYNEINQNNWFGFRQYLDVIPNRWTRAKMGQFRCGSHCLTNEIEKWKKTNKKK